MFLILILKLCTSTPPPNENFEQKWFVNTLDYSNQENQHLIALAVLLKPHHLRYYL